MNKAIIGLVALLLLAVAVNAERSEKPAGMTADQFREYKGYDIDRPELYCPLRPPTDYSYDSGVKHFRWGSVGTWGALSDGSWICGNWGDSPKPKTMPAVVVVVEPEPETPVPDPEPEPVCHEVCPDCYWKHKCVNSWAGFCLRWKWVYVCPACYDVCVA